MAQTRRLLVAAGIVALIMASGTRPAAAHASAGQGATNWVTTTKGLIPAVPGITVRVVDKGEHLEIHGSPNRTIMVLGYKGEPYARIDRDGVWLNRRSPAEFMNRFSIAPPRIPKTFDATAAPVWRRVGRSQTFRWHDHRTHHMNNDLQHEWHVPVTIDGTPAKISGWVLFVEPSTPTAAILVGVIGLGLCTAALLLRPRPATAILAVGIGASALVQLYGQYHESSLSFTRQLGTTAYSVGTFAAAFAIVVVALLRPSAFSAPALLLSGVTMAVCGGFARIDWLTHSQIPSALSYPFGTSLVMATLVVGGTIAGFAVRDLMSPLDAPERDTSA